MGLVEGLDMTMVWAFVLGSGLVGEEPVMEQKTALHGKIEVEGRL